MVRYLSTFIRTSLVPVSLSGSRVRIGGRVSARLCGDSDLRFVVGVEDWESSRGRVRGRRSLISQPTARRIRGPVEPG